ncbi:unnamed protein product [Arctogadus glacialis]
MPLPPEEPVCAEFQPNVFDPSRCHDCLRQKRVHAGAVTHTEEATPAAGTERATGFRSRTGNGSGASPETRTVTGEEEASPTVRGRDVSGRKEAGREEEVDRLRLKDDSDSQSAVSIYCDVSGGCRGYRRTSVCILSPDGGLYTCDTDYDSSSTDSCADQSDSPELSSSNTDDDYFPQQPAMTRLDRPAHRPDHREWMGDAQARDAFSKTPGIRGERESRDSGYFSMGRAAGSRSLHDQNPPAPFRHFERGHPVFNTRNIEPKDTVPFRNRHVAAPPDRLSQEEQDKNQIAPPPDPYEIAVEVEALVGPRSPSPTPFKIAESLASTSQRRQGSSYGKGNLSSPQSSSNQQPGRHDASRLGSTLQSRSSSPARGRSPFGRGEGSLSLNTRSFDGGGPERRSRSPSQAPSGRATGSGTLPRNFKSFASSAKSQGTTVSDFKSVLRKSSETNGVLSGRVQDGRSVSPLRKDHSTSGLASFRKTEPLSSISNGQRQLGNSYSSLPPRPDHGGFREVDSSLLARKSYSSTSHSPIRKSGSVTSLSSRSHPGRCGSPIREGYDIESQALLRNPDARNTQNNLEQDNCSSRSARRSNDTIDNHLMSNKTASSSYSRSRVNEGRSSSPGRKSHESPGRYLSKNPEPKGPFSDSGRTSPRRTYDSPTKGLKSESGGFARSRDGRSSSPPRRSYDPPVASSLRKTESVTSLNRLGSSTSRTPNAESPGYSILSQITTAESNSHSQRRTTQDSVMPERNSSSRSLRDSTYSSSACRTCSPSRTASSLAHRETSKTTSLHAPRETSKTTSFQAPRETSRPTISQAPRETSNTPSFQAQRETSRTTISQAPRETSNTPSFQAQRETSRTTISQAPRETSNTPSFQAQRETSRTTISQAPRETSNATSFQAQRETSRTTIAQAPRETNRTTIAQAPRETSNTTSFQAQRETSRTTRFQAPRETSRTTTLHAPRETRRTTSFQPSNEASQTVGSQGPLRGPETSRSAGFHVTRETSRQGFQESRETSRQGFQGPRETSRTASSVSRPASRSSSVNRFSDSRRGMEERSPSPENHRPFRRTQSPSPPPLIQLQRNTSSQSSMDSWESGGRSGEESGGRSREEYAVLADVPRGRTIHQREEAVKPQDHQAPRGRQELFKPASHSVSRHPSRERDQPGSHHREMLGWGNLSRSHSPTSLFRQGCGPTGEEGTGNTHIPELTQACSTLDRLENRKLWNPPHSNDYSGRNLVWSQPAGFTPEDLLGEVGETRPFAQHEIT